MWLWVHRLYIARLLCCIRSATPIPNIDDARVVVVLPFRPWPLRSCLVRLEGLTTTSGPWDLPNYRPGGVILCDYLLCIISSTVDSFGCPGHAKGTRLRQRLSLGLLLPTRPTQRCSAVSCVLQGEAPNVTLRESPLCGARGSGLDLLGTYCHPRYWLRIPSCRTCHLGNELKQQSELVTHILHTRQVSMMSMRRMHSL